MSDTSVLKDKKSLEEIIINLRCELRMLYESLSEKNDQLILLERDVRERDASIKFLRNEFYKLREDHNSRDSTPTNKDDANRDADSTTANNNIKNGQIEPIPSDLQLHVKERDALIKELSEKIIRLSHDLTYVQRKSLAKDDRIVELQNEIDKFRQVVRPLTQALFERKRSDSYDEYSPGIESSRIFSVLEPRIKRQAISAEPLSSLADMEGALMKIPKTSL